MTRTRANALVLVNWKGVFYERYLLDRHVTALEGANGAGKTTVMIAAYLVLLPDLTRLRFTNLGETSATGGDRGIWGRLGEHGRPSYAVLDFALPGKHRLVAGVHLERKGEPSVEPTPFIVSGLADDVRLQDLLLLRQDESEFVPHLHELRENAARLGGRLQELSARDYFAVLFEHGVTPLRLSTDEERNKLNEMLRTSMTGGISRGLTSELRSFLLKEDGGLADTLQHMRRNLDACRRTRTEVQEARRLEREIGAVFAAGEIMFAAAFLATRLRADDLSRRVTDAEAAYEVAVALVAAAREKLARTEAELDTLNGRRGQLGGLVESARAWRDQVRQALVALHALEHRAAELRGAAATTAAAGILQVRAEQEREGRRAELRRAQEGYRLAAAGLADLQCGLEGLHRRAGEYQQATRRLRQAEDLLGSALLIPETFSDRLSAARAELERADEERRNAATRHADADDHRRRHAEVMAAVAALVGGETEVPNAYNVALDALRRHRDLIALSARHSLIERDLAEVRRLKATQERVRARAKTLGVQAGQEHAADLVERLFAEAEAKGREHEEGEQTAKNVAAAQERLLIELETRCRNLVARAPEWDAHEARAARLREHLAVPVVDRASLDAARATLADQLTTARKFEEGSRDAQELLVQQVRELVASEGPFPRELLALRDRLGAELVAGSFEDIALGEAAALEARLGDLVRGLVVDDPVDAARAIASRPDTLGTVLLLPRDAELQVGVTGNAAQVGPRDVAVHDGVALRVSRIPSHPRIGRRAREQRAAELREEAEAQEQALEEARSRRRALERLIMEGDAILAGHVVWLAGDPAPELSANKRSIAETESQLETQRAVAASHAEALRQLRPRLEGLRKLLGEALMLDPPDHAERVSALERERKAAGLAKATVAQMGSHAELVEKQLTTLRQAPISAQDATKLDTRVRELKSRREQLDAGIEALSYVQANVEALSWEEAVHRLAAEQALVPALKAQLKEADAHQQIAEATATDAENQYEKAAKVFRDADATRAIAVAEHAAALDRFGGLGVPEPDENAVDAAAREASQLEAELRAIEQRRDPLISTRGAQEHAVSDKQSRQDEAHEKLASERREAEPALAQWEDLRERAQRYRVTGTLLTNVPTELQHVRGQVNLMQEAKAKRELLLERLKSAQGGTTLLAELTVLGDTADAAFADAHLNLWLSVRDWLRSRLPAQVAEVDDPREALMRLRDRLSSLDDRLTRQESDLRGASEDVANGISVQVRKARGQVLRLNKNLSGVSFGSIQSIRVRVDPVEKMEQVLRALREGSTQGLLFQSDIPLEEALEELFRSYGGGRKGGQRLLDYREYVHLQVEIRRKVGTDWEDANPTKLSTGEAIGVGAALMMVVLTEWERDSTLLRGKKSHGSLRFLFLDEASRLSHDNLGVLFDLCQALDLQLLIGAPEVARAEGNTTYRLVRHTTQDGREEVLVSGRRTKTEA